MRYKVLDISNDNPTISTKHRSHRLKTLKLFFFFRFRTSYITDYLIDACDIYEDVFLQPVLH